MRRTWPPTPLPGLPNYVIGAASESLIKDIARRLGDDISDEKPILDSRLPDGSRVAAIIPPCSIHGVTLTIRKFNSHKFKLNDLVQTRMLMAELAEQLAEFVVERKNILIRRNIQRQDDVFEQLGRIYPRRPANPFD